MHVILAAPYASYLRMSPPTPFVCEEQWPLVQRYFLNVLDAVRCAVVRSNDIHLLCYYFYYFIIVLVVESVTHKVYIRPTSTTFSGLLVTQHVTSKDAYSTGMYFTLADFCTQASQPRTANSA
jgi:hypothetical protein